LLSNTSAFKSKVNPVHAIKAFQRM